MLSLCSFRQGLCEKEVVELLPTMCASKKTKPRRREVEVSFCVQSRAGSANREQATEATTDDRRRHHARDDMIIYLQLYLRALCCYVLTCYSNHRREEEIKRLDFFKKRDERQQSGRS